jgi:cation:H+ antiporter
MPGQESWFLILGVLAGGFVCLFKGADWLVGASSQAARRYGVSTLVIGLTVIAFGTSAPEIVVSSLAASEGKVDLALGNVLGSNVANIGLVLGTCAIVLPKVMESRLERRDVTWLFASLAFFWWIALDHAISRGEAGMLLGAFVLYNVVLIATGKREANGEQHLGEYRYPKVWIGIGILAIALGAKLVVMGAEWGALRIGIPESVIGLTIVAIGTSLPELAAGLGGAFKGESDISLGNVVGSNIFNLMAVIGIVGLIQPFEPAAGVDGAALDEAFARALDEDLFVVLGFSLAAILLPRIGGARGGRAKGAFLLLAYIGYSAWLYQSRSF